MSWPSLRSFPLREAWPDLARTKRRRGVVHLVAWPRGQDRGAALCGARLDGERLEQPGAARRARVSICGSCSSSQGPGEQLPLWD